MSTLTDAATTDTEDRLYKLDDRSRDLLIESIPLIVKWSKSECKPKVIGGMEEWAKENKQEEVVAACDWYHSTWPMLRLLNMVAVPRWYKFYNRALSSILRKKPDANVLISACADWGMLETLHAAIQTAGTSPKITIYDICNTPLLACHWYAERHNLKIETVCDNIITSKSMPLNSFDLIVTDEFLTVLKDDYKPMIAKRWKELLAPGGALVTTAMLGGPTTPELRQGYADRARRLLDENASSFESFGIGREELLDRFQFFADVHTRHMLTDEKQIRDLLSEYFLGFMSVTPTPGECVNPTNSFQIVATVPHA